jgi:hypothetical protein
MTAERMRDDEQIVLDGILDEPAWGRAQHGGEFVMQDPILGGTPTERTEVRVVFNKDHLYIGATMFDSEPDKLKGNTRKRDEFLSADDRFMWTMDTFLNQQTGYFFEMNPSGLMADALMGPGGTNNREWDGIWNARVRQSEIGWVIEIDIPFKTLAFDPNAPAWGINFQRTVRRKNEEMLWTGHQRNQGLRRMATAGLLLGLSDVTQGLGLEVKPYAAGRISDAPGRVPALGADPSGGVGVDVTYNFTPSLRGVATINTDFAETEVDSRQVNLTRFPLFFPEKRSFFLDGATFFDFASNQAFFSRRIGLGADALPQRIDVGGKLTGQAGRQDIGALYVRTAEEGPLFGEDFLVLRARRRILRQSYVGGIYPGRATRGQSDVPTRHTAGFDARLATQSFLGNKNLEVSGYGLWNSRPEGGGDSGSWSVHAGYPNDVWEATATFQEVQEHHDPALGFLARRAYRLYSPYLRYSPRPNQHPRVRRFGFGADMELYTDMANELVTREIDVTAGRVELHSGDNAEFSVVPTYERLTDEFEINPGVVLPAGSDYRFTRYRLSLNTANQRVVALRPRITWGSFFSGDRRELGFDVAIRPRAGVTINLVNEWNRVDLPEGHFTTRLHRLVADTQFSPFMYLVNNVQYDSVSRVLGWQSRFRWIVVPGNDIFVIYTHNWLDDRLTPDRGFRTLDRRGAAKVVYTKRF